MKALARGALLALLVLAGLLLRVASARAQDKPATPDAASQRFEAASIKPCGGEQPPPSQSGGRAAGPGSAVTSPGRVHWECVTLDALINTAYAGPDNRLRNSPVQQLPDQPRLVRGGPGWVYSDRFAVEAKAAGPADRVTLIGPMLRALLEERFKLKTHRATEERSMYAATIAKGGLKLTPTAPGDCREPGSPEQPSAPSSDNLKSCGNLHMTWNAGNRRLEFTGNELHNFIQGTLSGSLLQRFVVDRTGVTGRFNFALEFTPDDDTPGGVAALAWVRRPGAETPTAPTIFIALEQQLGLKVAQTKAPAEYLVIDSVERPALDTRAPAGPPPAPGRSAEAFALPGAERWGFVATAIRLMLAVSASSAASILAKVTLTTALALFAVRLSRRSPAAVRHLLLLAAFAVLLALPVASTITPVVPIAVPVATPADAVALPVETNGADDRGSPVEAVPARGGSPGQAIDRATMVSWLWAIGAIVCVLPVAVGVWLIGSVRRSGLPWSDGQALANRVARDLDVERRVEILLHESLPGPVTCGVLRPAIVLPIDAQRWSEEDVRRAIVHELEHVRRRDWITQSIARVVCACYWFHPLVWIAMRQLALEAERACDDAVLKRSEATAYADQLVGLARRLSVSTKPPLLAMANRHDLSARVIAVLDQRQPRGRVDTPSIVLAGAASALIVVGISPIAITAGVAPAPQAVNGPRFDVVSIRPCQSETPTAPGARSSQGGFPNISPGRFTFECGTVERLISTAYVQNGEALLNQAARIGDVQWIKGVPGWVRSDKFTIEARAQGTPDRKEMLGPMLRVLLEDRFKLKLHRDTEDVAQYVMTVAKGGLKLKPMGPDGCTAFDPDNPPSRATIGDPNAKPICGNMTMLHSGALTKWTLGGETMERFAGTLSTFMDRHAIDRTGVTDTFNIKLEFQADEHVPGPDKRYGPPAQADVPQGDGPNIFKALEDQLGLKLESTKGQHGFLVIDHVEKPTADGPLVHFVPPARAGGGARRGR